MAAFAGATVWPRRFSNAANSAEPAGPVGSLRLSSRNASSSASTLRAVDQRPDADEPGVAHGKMAFRRWGRRRRRKRRGISHRPVRPGENWRASPPRKRLDYFLTRFEFVLCLFVRSRYGGYRPTSATHIGCINGSNVGGASNPVRSGRFKPRPAAGKPFV